MYKHKISYKTKIKVNESYEAMPLEYEVKKITEEKVPIQSVSPEIFTERKDGVKPEYDIRTDKWLIAELAMEAVSQQQLANRGKKAAENEKSDKKTETTAE